MNVRLPKTPVDPKLLDSNRNSPRGKRGYIWVSWVTGLLGGTAKCRWAAWFKAHYRYAKTPVNNTAELAQWTREHDELVRARVGLLRADGWTVNVENENTFKLEGRTATLGGKPDLVAARGLPSAGILRVIDEKSGSPRESDLWQVKLYMWALSKIDSGATRIDGEIQYRGHSVEILAEQFVEADIEQITNVLSWVGGEEEPPRTPSLGECEWCNIADCPDRMKTNDKVVDARKFF